MEDDCAFFASGVPASIGDAVRSRGAVFGLLEEGADVVSGWEGDLGEVPRGTECFGKGVGVLGVDCFFFRNVLPQWLRSSSAFSWGALALVPSSLMMPTLIDFRWMVVHS